MDVFIIMNFQNQSYYKFANKDYLDFANELGWIGRKDQIFLHIYSEEMQKFRLAAEGFGNKNLQST